MDGDQKSIPFKEKMWTKKSDDEVRLLGSKCPVCEELFFPIKTNDICTHCQHEGLEQVELGPFGTIVSYTTVMQQPAGGYYFGPVPYSYGLVDLDDGVRIETHLGGDFGKLKVGMKVRLTIEILYTNEEGNKVQAYRFLPVYD